MSVERVDRTQLRLVRSEPTLFLGPPQRSKLVIVCAILDAAEDAEKPVREFVTVNVRDFLGVWPMGLQDAVTRFPRGVRSCPPRLAALAKDTIVSKLTKGKPVTLEVATPAYVVGEKGGRRAAVLVRGSKTEAVFVEDVDKTVADESGIEG
jgi:hypothetical protein